MHILIKNNNYFISSLKQRNKLKDICKTKEQTTAKLHVCSFTRMYFHRYILSYNMSNMNVLYYLSCLEYSSRCIPKFPSVILSYILLCMFYGSFSTFPKNTIYRCILNPEYMCSVKRKLSHSITNPLLPAEKFKLQLSQIETWKEYNLYMHGLLYWKDKCEIKKKVQMYGSMFPSSFLLPNLCSP